MVTAAGWGRLHVTTADRLVTSLTTTLEGGVGGSEREGRREDVLSYPYKVMGMTQHKTGINIFTQDYLSGMTTNNPFEKK